MHTNLFMILCFSCQGKSRDIVYQRICLFLWLIFAQHGLFEIQLSVYSALSRLTDLGIYDITRCGIWLLTIFHIPYTVDGFIVVGTNFRGLNKNDTFEGFKIRGHSVFFHNSYKKLPFRGFLNSWIGPSTKTTKIGTPRNLSHPQYPLSTRNEKGYITKMIPFFFCSV